MVEQQVPKFNLSERLSNIELLLRATEPKEMDDYYNPRRPLLGKELSIGLLEKSDMKANFHMCWFIEELFLHAQFDAAFDFMPLCQNDIKARMSIGGELLRSLVSPEVRYKQEQTLHEYTHTPEKKGFFGGSRPVNPPPTR